MTAIQLTLMTVDEAQAIVETIKSSLEGVRAQLFELREREGWRALGYETWQSFITQEFHMSRIQAHRLLNAHMVDRILAPTRTDVTNGYIAQVPEAHARELAPLVSEPEAVREVHAEVQDRTEGKPTAADYREAVDRRLGRVQLNDQAHRPPVERMPIEEPMTLGRQDLAPAPTFDEFGDEQDHDGAVAAARLNAQYSSGIAAALKLTFLDARAVVGLLGRDRRLVHGENARMLRRWLDAVDIELRAADAQPLRMVGGMHG